MRRCLGLQGQVAAMTFPPRSTQGPRMFMLVLLQKRLLWIRDEELESVLSPPAGVADDQAMLLLALQSAKESLELNSLSIAPPTPAALPSKEEWIIFAVLWSVR